MDETQNISWLLPSLIYFPVAFWFVLLLYPNLIKWINEDPDAGEKHFRYTPTPSRRQNNARRNKPKTRRMNCINCNFSLEKSSTDLCPNCGKSVHKKVKYKTCDDCGSDYDHELSNCPICG